MIRMSVLIVLVLMTPFKSFGSWIDPDTPTEDRSTNLIQLKHGENEYAPSVSDHNKTGPFYSLVFSDEFNTPNRTFADGEDPRWTALDKNDYTNNALHYYSPDNIRTNDNGELVITTQAKDTQVIGFDDVKREKSRVTKHFKSGMLQSWNKFCFTGGIIEAEVTLPGFSDIGGLWPAFWILGNLARHTYVGSSTHLWPWSTSICNWQTEYAQMVSGCRNVGHYAMEAGKGRGAPEIDIFEVQPGPYKANDGPFWQMPVGQPFMSSSYQVAPGRSWNRPGDGWWPAPGQWYSGLRFGYNTSLNILFYGSYTHKLGDSDPRMDYWSDAISYNKQLTNKHFQGNHIYRLQWGLPQENGTDRGYLQWFLDGELVLEINGTGLEDAKTGSEISREPSSILMNTAVSSQWGFPSYCPANCKCQTFDCHSPHYEDTCGFSPGFCLMMSQIEPVYKVNWVRVYQDPTDEQQKVGCSTPERPTKKFIEAFKELYMKEGDKEPLLPIQRGRGKCTPGSNTTGPESCGGETKGTCTPHGACHCNKGFTGPNCLAADGYDPIVYESDASLADLGFSGPGLTFSAILAVFAILFGTMVFVVKLKKAYSHPYGGWKPIPDVQPLK